MKKKLLNFTFFMFLFSNTFSQNVDYQILLKSRSFTPRESIELNLNSTELNNEYVYRLIQFNNIPLQHEKDMLKTKGITLLNYIPNNAYIGKIKTNLNTTLLSQSGIRCIISLKDEDKISPSLKNKKLYSWAIEENYVNLKVKTFESQNFQKLISSIAKLEGSSVTNKIEEINVLTIKILEKDISTLSKNNLVMWIEPISPPDIKDDTKGRSLHRSNAINTAYSTGRKYDGTGVNVALADDGFIGPHIDYTGRLTQTYVTNNGDHGDMTAGIMFGAGNINPSIRGMASGADMNYYNISGYSHVFNAPTFYTTLGTVVTSTSYSQGTGGQYTPDTEFIDDQIYGNPQLIHVFSAGNAGTTDHGYGAGALWGNITGGYKAGKNVIASGNLNDRDVLENSSSRGPAKDGRIKPDLCANGIGQLSTDDPNTYQVGGGTSAAAPGIAGVVTQLYQCYKDHNGGVNPESALIKASLLNTAEDLGNPGPDFKHGWGRINGLKAARIIEDGRYLSTTVSQNANNSHTVVVPANVDQVRIMVYWTDYEGSSNVTKALVNDINMQVVSPSNTTYNPWVLDPTPNTVNLNTNAVRGIDDLNNVEQVTIDAPAAGNYTVNINGFSIPQGPQKYYVLYDFIYEGVELTYPIGGEGFVPGETEVLRWDAFGTSQIFSLEYTTNNGSTWSSIGTVTGARRYYDWTVPSTLSSQVKVRITRNGFSSESDTLLSIVGVPTNLSIDYVCPDTIALSWNAVNGVTEYEISMLGNKYMDSIGTSTTNSFKIPNLSHFNEHWFSVKSSGNGLTGRRAIAIRQDAGLYNCVVAMDVSISEILTPQKGTISSCKDLSNTDVSVQLSNVGLNPASSIQVYYQINSGTIISENYTGTINPGNTFNYTFTAKANLSTSGTYNITTWVDWPSDENNYNDTLQSTTFTSNSSTIVSFPYSEDFESFNLCTTGNNCESDVCSLSNGWINATNTVGDDIDWRTDNGGTTSTLTGPSTDFNPGTSTGKYLYIEASSCDYKAAELLSPCINLVGVTYAKIEFAYHMYGSEIGELHIDIVTGDSLIEDIIPAIIGNKGDNWLTAYIDITPFVGDTINVRFRANTEDGFHGDIAIDAFSVDSPPAPTANFTFTNQDYCIGEAVTFSNTTIEAIDSIYWDFGIGATPATSTIEGPHNVSYSSSGNKTISLFVKSNIGNDLISKNIVIEGKPTASFNYSFGSDTTYFIDSTSETITNWLWNFGNGVLSVSENPWHRYKTPGDYDVTLIVTSDCGKDTIVQKITIEDKTNGIESSLSSIINISPNPSTGTFNVELVNLEKNGNIKIEIIDIVGKMIYQQNEMITSTKTELSIDISKQATGTYFMKIHTNDGIITEKIIKK